LNHLLAFSFFNFFFYKAKLPKWFGERPGKKSGDPDSPDDEEEAGGEAPGMKLDNSAWQLGCISVSQILEVPIPRSGSLPFSPIKLYTSYCKLR